MLKLENNKSLLQLGQVLYGFLILHSDFCLLAELILKPCIRSDTELRVDWHWTEELDTLGQLIPQWWTQSQFICSYIETKGIAKRIGSIDLPLNSEIEITVEVATDDVRTKSLITEAQRRIKVWDFIALAPEPTDLVSKLEPELFLIEPALHREVIGPLMTF